MKWHRLMVLAVAAGQLVASGAADSVAANPGTTKLPPVLRPTEPPDSVLLTLPTPPSLTPAVQKIAPLPPVARLAPMPRKLVEDAPATVKAPAREEVAPEVAAYCRKQIGHWKIDDARKLLGAPRRQRSAYDENRTVNGTIYAFHDPTGQNKEMELDFDLKSGNLRTVFVYPPRLTWQECRRLWNGPVATADAARGRKFYSYTNRRLDVLVDPVGKVISLGWY